MSQGYKMAVNRELIDGATEFTRWGHACCRELNNRRLTLWKSRGASRRTSLKGGQRSSAVPTSRHAVSTSPAGLNCSVVAERALDLALELLALAVQLLIGALSTVDRIVPPLFRLADSLVTLSLILSVRAPSARYSLSGGGGSRMPRACNFEGSLRHGFLVNMSRTGVKRRLSDASG